MANTATLASLRTRALDYADMTGSSFPVAAQVNDYINEALSEIHHMMVDADPSWGNTIATQAVSVGTEGYNLPSDFFQMREIFLVANSRRYRVQRMKYNETEGWRNAPLTAGSLELWYVPVFTPITVDATTVNQLMPPGWDDFAALSAAVRLLVREETNAQQLIAERERVRANILKWASPRDLAEADSIADVSGRFDDEHSRWFHDNVPNYRYRIEGTKLYICELERFL